MYINTISDFRKAVRNGPYAWPGGYPMFFLTSDGEALSYAAVKQERRNILEAIRDKSNNGWRVVAVDINWEDPDLYCSHTSERIESAYADDESERVKRLRRGNRMTVDHDAINNVANTLEAMIDKHGLGHVLTGLELVCTEKAAHIRHNWQDNNLANEWDRQAKAIHKIADKTPAALF
jgi:hypothetical protein